MNASDVNECLLLSQKTTETTAQENHVKFDLSLAHDTTDLKKSQATHSVC